MVSSTHAFVVSFSLSLFFFLLLSLLCREKAVAGPNYRRRGPDLRAVISAGLYTRVEVVKVDPDGKGIIVRQLPAQS